MDDLSLRFPLEPSPRKLRMERVAILFHQMILMVFAQLLMQLRK